MQTYIPITIALLTSLVSVFGDNWIKDGSTDKKLSLKAKAILLIASISFIFSLKQLMKSEEQNTQYQNAKNNFNFLAKKKLKEAISQCTTSLYQFGKPTGSVDTILKYNDLPNLVKLDTIYKASFYSKIKFNNLFLSISTNQTWGQFLYERCVDTKQILEDVLTKHGAYLNLGTVSNINAFLDDSVFNSLMHNTKNMISMNSLWQNNLKFYVAIGMKQLEGYQEFIKKLVKLQIISDLNEI